MRHAVKTTCELSLDDCKLTPEDTTALRMSVQGGKDYLKNVSHADQAKTVVIISHTVLVCAINSMIQVLFALTLFIGVKLIVSSVLVRTSFFLFYVILYVVSCDFQTLA